MTSLRTIVSIGAILFATSLHAQQLSKSGKTVKADELPEYVIINCDNTRSGLTNSIRIVIQSKNSEYEKSLQDLQALLEENNYLKISNQTDLLNAMSRLGFDYINAFPQNPGEGNSYSRTGFVFRKKDKYRKEH